MVNNAQYLEPNSLIRAPIFSAQARGLSGGSGFMGRQRTSPAR